MLHGHKPIWSDWQLKNILLGNIATKSYRRSFMFLAWVQSVNPVLVSLLCYCSDVTTAYIIFTFVLCYFHHSCERQCVVVSRSWDRLFTVISNNQLAFYRDQRHYNAVCVLFQSLPSSPLWTISRQFSGWVFCIGELQMKSMSVDGLFNS